MCKRALRGNVPITMNLLQTSFLVLELSPQEPFRSQKIYFGIINYHAMIKTTTKTE